MEKTRHLLAPIDYGELHRQMAHELGARGPSASNSVSVLVSVLEQEDSIPAAHEEFKALGLMGPAARGAVPSLVQWLAKPDTLPARYPGARVWQQGAAWALVRIAPEDPRVATALVSALALCGTEKNRAFLTPAEFTEPTDLQDFPPSFGNGWPSTRRSLIRAIGGLRPQNPQTLAALFHELREGDYGAQATAADTLGDIHPTTPEIVAALKDALLRTEAEHLAEWRELAALTPLYLHGDSAHLALSMTNPAPEVSMIFNYAPNSPTEHLDTLYLPGAGFPGWGLRLRVIRSLGRIGASAQDVLPFFLKDCENQTALWRFDAAVAAWRISGGSSEAIAVFEHGLRASDLESRQLAVAHLSELVARFPKALALLCNGLQDPDLRIRLQVLNSLGALSTNAVPALPAIEALTSDRKIVVRITATQALQAIQPVGLLAPTSPSPTKPFARTSPR